MLLTFHHTGGDWWFSSMERVWFFVAHYAAENQAPPVVAR